MVTCACPACQLRRLTPALVLIAVGTLLLVHLLRPAFTSLAAAAAFLVFAGALGLLSRLLPRPANHPAPASLFFPLLVLAVGVLILIRHALPQVPLGQWIADYWPVLLIVWGLTRLLEHFLRPPSGRTGLSGGEILLLMLIIVFGLAFSGAYHFQRSRMAEYWGIHLGDWNPFYQSYTFSAAARASLPAAPAAPATIVIRGFRGDVTLAAAAPGASTIAASVQDTVRAESRADAATLFSRHQPVIRQEGDRWLVLPAGDDTPHNVDADLQLTLPASLPVTVEVANGDITIPAWNASLDLRSTHGSITVARVQGGVTIAAAHDSISLDRIQGPVSISGGGDDVALSNIQGPATLDGEFTGALNFRALPAGLRFHSRRTTLDVASLPGSLVYDLDQIAITNAQAITLRTRDEQIEVREFSGPLTVHGRNQSIRLAAPPPPAAPISASDRNADITLTLPAASRFHLDAAARNGSIHNAFPASAQAAAPVVHLRTTNGTIAVRPRSTSRPIPGGA
jgi:hypothetical protein